MCVRHRNPFLDTPTCPRCPFWFANMGKRSYLLWYRATPHVPLYSSCLPIGTSVLLCHTVTYPHTLDVSFFNMATISFFNMATTTHSSWQPTRGSLCYGSPHMNRTWQPMWDSLCNGSLWSCHWMSPTLQVITSVNCTGTEKSLDECDLVFASPSDAVQCGSGSAVGISCINAGGLPQDVESVRGNQRTNYQLFYPILSSCIL